VISGCCKVVIEEFDEHQIADARWRGEADVRHGDRHLRDLQSVVLEAQVGLVVGGVVMRWRER
jgi:hypothetical protein